MSNATDATVAAAKLGRPSRRPPAHEGAAPPALVDIDGIAGVDDGPDLPSDQAAASNDDTRTVLLVNARRRLVPIRRTFVQLPRGNAHAADRAGPLARLVEGRQHVALDLLLLLLALQPIISDQDPLPGKTWARLLSTSSDTRSPASAPSRI